MSERVRKAREKALETDRDKAVNKLISDLIEQLKKSGLSEREARETVCRRCGKNCRGLKEKEKTGN